MRAHIFALTFGAAAALACGKPELPAERAPEPATAQVSAPDPAAPEKPVTPTEPDLDRRLPSAEEARGPINRTEAIKKTFDFIEKGELRQAFKNLAEGVVWTEVGLPDGELDSIDEIIAYQQKSRTGFSDFRLEPKRIIESADYQVVEFVWSARHTGAFADGTAATDKTVTLPGAMLARYQTDGLIDRVWVFQDWPNALQQLGLAPGLPEDFRPFPLPERIEVVIGPYDARFRDRYGIFVARIGPSDYKTTLAERTSEDFAWWDLGAGQLVTRHDGRNTYFANRMGSFERCDMEIETAVGAGPYFAAFVTNKLVYKGGFLGVPADDQKITTHTLDIVKVDPESLRLQTLASYGNSYEIMAALNLTAGGTPPPENEQRFGIPACDLYVDEMRACVDTLDGETHAAAKAALEQQILTWHNDAGSGVTRDVLIRACEASIVSARKSFGDACPRVDWR